MSACRIEEKVVQTQGKRVAFLCKMLPHYRGPFFEKLRRRLAENNIELVLIYGDGRESDRAKGDLIDLPWGKFVANKSVRLFNRELIWQPVLKEALQADLVIVEQANSLLVNHYIQFLHAIGKIKIAFWGHGKNYLATNSDQLSESLKRFLCTKVWWWFAYTEGTKATVQGLGFPPQRITVVQNSIDTSELVELNAQISETECANFREQHGLSANTGLFCGALYKEKKLDFLIEAACIVRSSVPDFCLLIVGSGPQKNIAVEASQKFPWIKFVGPQFGRSKALAYRVSKIALIPGAIGLALLDSFALGVPLVTTDSPFHGPEISYLENGVNSVMTADNVSAYSDKVIELLTNPASLSQLQLGTKKDASRYNMETMVINFAQGIIDALSIE